MAWLQSIISAVRQREKQATYACLEMLSSIFSFIKPIEEHGSGTEPSIERPSSTLSETPGKTGQPAAPAPAKKTPPKERFTAWLLKQKEPDSFEELLDLIDKAPMSESTKDVLLKYLRKVPKSDELASVVISFHGTDNEVLLRTDYVNALCDIASKGVCVGALVCVRRTGKTMGIVEALISARAKVLGRRDPALFFHERQLQLPFSQCKSLLAFLSRCGVPMIFDEYASAEGPTGANLCMFIKSFLDDPAYIRIPRRLISVILMGSEHGAIMHSWQKALDGMQHRGAAATPERLPMPPPSLLYAMYKKRTKTTDVAGFLRTYACSGCNLAEAMELGPPTPEELLRRGFQSVTFLAYEVTAVLYRLASGHGSLTEQNQAAVHELVQQGFIENRVRGKLGEYDPTDPRLLTLMGLQKGQDMEKIEGEVLELMLRHPEVIDWLKAEFGVHGDVDVHYGKLSRGQMKADMDLLLLHQQTDRGWFFSAKRQEKKQALYDSFLKHLNLLPQLGPPEVKIALQRIKEVTLVAFSAIEDSEPFKGTGLEENFQFKHEDGSTSTAKVGVRRMLLGEILQGVEKRRGWQWKKFRYLKPAEDM